MVYLQCFLPLTILHKCCLSGPYLGKYKLKLKWNLVYPAGRVISTYGNIRRYPIAPIPLFVCARSSFFTWCFVYKVINISSSIKNSTNGHTYGMKINQYHTHIDLVILYLSPKCPLLNPLIYHKISIQNMLKDRLVKHTCQINDVTWCLMQLI